MSQPGESDREVFSHSMNTIAQFQSAVVVGNALPQEVQGCARMRVTALVALKLKHVIAPLASAP